MESGLALTAEVLRIKTTSAKKVVDLSDRLEAVVRKAKMEKGLCTYL